MSSNPAPSGVLAKRRLGVVHLVFFTIAASAPLTVLGGGVTTIYAVTGSLGQPLAYLLLAVVLGIFAVGYGAMSRHVANAGAFYSYIANGTGRAAGVSASFVALASYNAIQIGLYGLFGYIFDLFMEAKFQIDQEWWIWALVGWALVGILGLLRVDLNATVLAVLLIAECIVVAIFNGVALAHPAEGSISTDGFLPDNLFATGLGAVLAFAVAAFTGFESGAIYSEEVKDPRRTVARATYIAVAFTGIFYALSAWATQVLTGPANVQQTTMEQGPGVVFGTLDQYINTTVSDIAFVLFFTSVFAALLSFHNGVARYLFALGRERVLPKFLGRTGARTLAPIAGSMSQSLVALVVVGGFVVADKDPLFDLFTWLSGMSSIGVVLLMAATSVGIVGFFRGRGGEESAWQRAVAPGLATILLGALLVVMIVNFDSLLGPEAPKYLGWLLPGLILLAAVVGLIWGAILKGARPDVYQSIGRGVGAPMATDEQSYVPVRM